MIASIFGDITPIPMHIIIVISCYSPERIRFSGTPRAHRPPHDEPPSLCLVQLRRLTVQLPSHKPIFVLFSIIQYRFYWSNILHREVPPG